MRLYNKTPRDIWADIPLPYRLVLIAGSLFITLAFLFLSAQAIGKVSSVISAGKGPVDVRGERAVSLLDPSMASDGKTVSALVYTGLEVPNRIKISLATARFPCEGFRWNQNLFEERRETLLAPDGTSNLADGVIRYETPSLVYDPQDRAAPWKVFAYRYFWMGNAEFAQRYSMIVMRSAPAIDGPWSKEEWLLASAPDHPPMPYQGLIRTHINQLHPDLARITAYSRPSVVEDRGVLLMSLTGFSNPTDIDRVILLISLDHGKRWVYAGTLLNHAQLAQIGQFTRISGASLVKQGQAIYLAAVLGDAQVGATGSYLFRITDPGKATVLSNDAGVPTPVRFIGRQSVEPTAIGGGYATFDQTCPMGIVTSEHSGLRQSYQLFSTLETPADN